MVFDKLLLIKYNEINAVRLFTVYFIISMPYIALETYYNSNIVDILGINMSLSRAKNIYIYIYAHARTLTLYCYGLLIN